MHTVQRSFAIPVQAVHISSSLHEIQHKSRWAAWRLCAGSFEEIYANEKNLTVGNILTIFETRGLMVINAGNENFSERKREKEP